MRITENYRRAHGGGWRVAIVVRPVDRALDSLRIVVLPLAVLAVSLPVLQAVAKSFGGAGKGWLLLAAGIATAVVYVVVIQTSAVTGRVDLVFARVRRRLTLACNRDAYVEPRDARMACWLTPEVLRAPLFRYDDQREAVRVLTEACRDDPGHYWFLEGRSGTGKTRAGLLLVQELVRDLSLLPFGSRSYLYDFRDDASVQDTVLRRLATSWHKDEVVLVDNFQLVRPEILSALTSGLTGTRGPRPERLIVFLTRPLDAWNGSPDIEVSLVSEARAARRYLELGGAPAEPIVRSLNEIDPAGSERVRELQEEAVASAPQLRLAQVIAQHGSMPPEVASTLELLEGDAGDTPALELAPLLAVVTALAMHRGSFSRGALRAAVRTASASDSRWTSLSRRMQMRAGLRALRRVRLVSRTYRGSSTYEFHETMAKLCVDRLAALPAFQLSFTAVGRARLDELLSREELLNAWLVAVEIGAQEIAERTFDAAMASGPYSRMLRCLRRASERYPLSPPLELQLAILLDRTGDFAASREEFASDLMERLDPSSELSTIFAATRLETSHAPADVAAGLELLGASPDGLVRLIGQYWQLHIDAHRGRFASRELLRLATEACRLMPARASHWLSYSLGRMHFDSLRHQYLEGGTPIEDVVAPERRAIGAFLRPRLASYEAFHTLYTKAHLVGHVLLVQRGIYLERVTDEQAAHAGVRRTDVATADALAATAQRLYGEAREQFAQYGDREASYLQADVLNADMVAGAGEADDIPGRLQDYENFIDATGFDDIASYPHLYHLRWHMLNYYAIARDSRPAEPMVLDDHLAAARHRLDRVVALDAAVGNEYGLLRARLLKLLLDWVREPQETDAVASLSERMAERGYRREQRLLNHLANRGLLPIVELERVFRFYPFVHQ